jgi:Protein of unknown function (DUF2924)
MSLRFPGGAMTKTIIQLSALIQANTATLQRIWQEVFGLPAPGRAKPDLLRRCIAHRLQEDAIGGLNPRLRRQLAELGQELEQGATALPLPAPALKSGTRLVRTWNGDTHRVTVEDAGFTYRDRRYRSLSEIARLITGTRWSGPKFFGITQERRHG